MLICTTVGVQEKRRWSQSLCLVCFRVINKHGLRWRGSGTLSVGERQVLELHTSAEYTVVVTGVSAKLIRGLPTAQPRILSPRTP